MAPPSHSDSDVGSAHSGGSVNRVIALTALASIAITALLAKIEYSRPHGGVDWTVFVVIATLLLVSEIKATTWLRFGDGGVVTPSWSFAFALVLLGSPTVAVVVMALTTVIADVAANRALRKIVFNTAQISLSLAAGGLVIVAFGIRGPLFEHVTMPFSWGLALIVSGTLVFAINGALICYLLAVIEGKRFLVMLRDEFVLTISADAAMLALAPILVISLRYSMLMLPLIGTATFLVFQTARLALQRAHDASHDPLTQVLNRRAFGDTLAEFTEDGTGAGVVAILDLDRFKEINDRLGHQTGDEVLVTFARRITGALPAGATVARLGGDEFAIFVRDVGPDDALELVTILHEALQIPLVVNGFPLTTGSSIGVALFPDHGATPSQLLHSADVAMYRAKRQRSCVELYQAVGTTRDCGRVALLGDLAAAIQLEQFALDYQPQVDFRTGTISGVEALIRWDHPELGRIQPDDFVALAEQTDLIGPLTDLVIERALREIGSLDHELTIAVNASARNLEDRHFAGRTLEALRLAGTPSDRLELEITESAIARQPERTVLAVEALRSAGVRISIDDFGTGYSSFATLRDLPVDRIKIDRSFISRIMADERDEQIVRTVIDLAHRLGLEIVSEGVEDAETFARLRAARCDVAQGYFISQPIPLELLRRKLDDEPHECADRRPATDLLPAFVPVPVA